MIIAGRWDSEGSWGPAVTSFKEMRYQQGIAYVDHDRSTARHGEILSHVIWSHEPISPTQVSYRSTYSQ
jgi:hypothetical protein